MNSRFMGSPAGRPAGQKCEQRLFVRFTCGVDTKHVAEVLKIEIGKVKREFNCRVKLRLAKLANRTSGSDYLGFLATKGSLAFFGDDCRMGVVSGWVQFDCDVARQIQLPDGKFV
jgi:hypothetical protein